MDRRKILTYSTLALLLTSLRPKPVLALSSKIAMPRSMGKPSLLELCSIPIIKETIYRSSPGGQIAADGSAGRNRSGIWMIEEQRAGGEYVIAGILSHRPDWVQLGWKQIDWGNAQQLPNGEYKSLGGQYHSMSIFLHSFAMACMAQPSAVTKERLNYLYRGAKWLAENMEEGIRLNAPYTHRNFLCMSVIGRIAYLTGQSWLYESAFAWAKRGLALQLPNGICPEKGGADMSYQMVGPFHSLLFLPVNPNAALNDELRHMSVKAISWWCSHLRPDGTVDPTGSTRIGIERQTDGHIKTVNYKEIVRTLAWGAAELNHPEFLTAAEAVARNLR